MILPCEDVYALQAVSYRWSELFNALWWFITFAGLFGRYSITQGILKNSFQNKLLTYNIKKKWSPAFREWKENFLSKEVLKTVGLLQS